MPACIFCKIIKGESPASLVFEDDNCLAFMDIQPVNPGHVLVIPRRHAVSLADMNAEECARLFSAAHALAAAVRASGLRCEGVNLLLADGEAAGQEVFHVHVHVFPRFAGDGFGFTYGPEYAILPERRELDEQARKIRSALTPAVGP
ncbi:MAG: HIT family protein [Anaerolineales bacterium]|nr:HIT family protein [Anaerolineales bacterium]